MNVWVLSKGEKGKTEWKTGTLEKGRVPEVSFLGRGREGRNGVMGCCAIDCWAV